jgi:hypothetical protein
MRTDAAKMLNWKTYNALDNGKRGKLQAKVFCSNMAVNAAVDAMTAVRM